MAVNSITFGEINSADYGIYISGEGVFDAPKRAVEMVNIPGRNGALAIDQGYYENIVVTYPAHNYEPEMSDFKANLSAFRNALASQIGYQRLSDTFHPNEYRMAVFDEGLDINPIKYNTASQFDIKFDCKPQRFLTSGETETTVSSGDTLTNPTQYEASPLLTVKGYGTISFNGYSIEILNEVVGDISVSGGEFDAPKTISFDGVPMQTGDAIDINGLKFVAVRNYSTAVSSATVQSWSGDTSTAPTVTIEPNVQKSITVAYTFNDPISLSYGTAADKTITANIKVDGGTAQAYVAKVSYDGNSTIRFKQVIAGSKNTLKTSVRFPNAVAHSTEPTYGDPTYIDCDLGEVYEVNGTEITSLNRYVALGSDLPVLKSGANTITFDNTITELKVTPRWYKL